MSFNLKRKKEAQLTDYDIQQLRNLVVQNINSIKNMPPDSAPEAMDQFNLQLQQLGITFQEAQSMVPELAEILEQQSSMQDKIDAPPLVEDQPVVFNSMASSIKDNIKKGAKNVKPFNLKKAYQDPFANPNAVPFEHDNFNDSAEIGETQMGLGQEGSSRKFSSGSDVQNWLENETDLSRALNLIAENDDGTGRADLVKEMVEDYYTSMDDPMIDDRAKEKKAGEIFDSMPETMKEGGEIPASFKEFEVNNIIKKLAEKYVKEEGVKSFNLTKTAQHKTQENVIMWGPAETRKVDPFYRQPVSDWHIIERNKGFGLVVDDVWNIDYETIWRENIMDKYSRPYRDKDGNWVGGYIQKRFEVDKNIPVESNIQLKPGQIRRPVLPEYGNLESRLQHARSKGEVEGAIDTSKPFNWKEASSKKKRKQA